MSKGKSTEQSSGFLSNLFGAKKEKGVTKQRGKSKDRYHQDPPEPAPGEYDSEEEIRTGYSHHEPSGEKRFEKSKLFKSSPDKHSSHQRDTGDHTARSTTSNAKGGGREIPKKSKIESLFGSSDDSKSTKKKSQDRYHQENPYEKYEKEKEDSKGRKGKSGGGGGGLGGLFSSGTGGNGGGSSGKTKVGKSKGHSTGRESKGGSGGFSIPSF